MAFYDDDNFGEIFPRRTGVPTGSANERKMLDVIGGSEGFRTQQKTNLDGSITMLRTRNGMPEFSRSEVKKTVGGVSRRMYCRMMSDLYPRGADVTLPGFVTQNNDYDWPIYPTSEGILAPNKSYLGTRASGLYADSPGYQVWYDNRQPNERSFPDVLSWNSIIQPGKSSRYSNSSTRLTQYYNSILGNTKNDNAIYPNGGSYERALGLYIPGQGLESFQNRSTRYDNDSVGLYRNGTYTGIRDYIVAACAVVVEGVVTYRLLNVIFGWAALGNPSFVISNYSESGLLIDTTSVTIPSTGDQLLYQGPFKWNRSGSQCCVACNKNRILLIEPNGSASISGIAYIPKTTVTTTYSEDLPPAGTQGNGSTVSTSNTTSSFYYLLDAGYYGDDLRYIVSSDSTTSYALESQHGPYWNEWAPDPNPTGIPNETRWATGHGIETEITTVLLGGTTFVHPTGDILATIGGCTLSDGGVYVDDLSLADQELANLVLAESLYIRQTQNGSLLEFADFQQNFFAILEMQLNENDTLFSTIIVSNGETTRLHDWESLNNGNFTFVPIKYLANDTNDVIVYEPATLNDSNRLFYLPNLIHSTHAVSRDGLVFASSRLYALGITGGLETISSKNKAAFKVGDAWTVTDLKLTTYDGSVKWIGEPLILDV